MAFAEDAKLRNLKSYVDAVNIVLGNHDSSIGDIKDELKTIAKSDDLDKLVGKVADVSTAVDKLNGAVTEEGSVAKSIKDAIDTFKTDVADVTYVKLDNYNTKVSEIDSSIDDLQEKVDLIMNSENATDDLMSLVELGKWVKEHEGAAAGYASKIKTLSEEMAGLLGDEEKEGLIDTKIKTASDALDAKITDITKDNGTIDTKITAAIADVNTAADALEARVEANEGAIAHLNADDTSVGSVDYKIAQALVDVNSSIGTVKNSITDINSSISVLKDASTVVGSVDYKIAQALVDVDSSIGSLKDGVSANTAAIAHLNADDASVGSVAEKIKTALDPVKNDVSTLKGADNVEGSVAKSIKDALALRDSSISANENAIATLNGNATTAGSVAYAVKAAQDDLQGKIDIINGSETTAGSIAKAVADLDASVATNYVKLSVYNAKMTDVDASVLANATDIKALEDEVIANEEVVSEALNDLKVKVDWLEAELNKLSTPEENE